MKRKSIQQELFEKDFTLNSRFRPKVQKSKKSYTRKRKHKNEPL